MAFFRDSAWPKGQSKSSFARQTTNETGLRAIPKGRSPTFKLCGSYVYGDEIELGEKLF